jgi:quercetin dioxygenase-like cupin family protein
MSASEGRTDLPGERPAEAEAAKTVGSVVVESLGKTWLLTIADKGWRPPGGERIAEIGPLPITAGRTYSAQYMEAIFTPGMTAPAHTHAGPEAWYTQAGETCLETPDGKQIGRAGGPPVIVPGGPPMHLTATGTEQRRALRGRIASVADCRLLNATQTSDGKIQNRRETRTGAAFSQPPLSAEAYKAHRRSLHQDTRALQEGTECPKDARLRRTPS